jgi:two-component system, LytTR family, sensor kinase
MDSLDPLGVGRARRWGLILLGVTAIGLLNFFVALTSWRAEGNVDSAKYPLLWEMTGIYTALLLLPPLLFVMRRFPITRATMVTRLPLHAASFVAFALTHTLLMWGTRTVLYRLLGWGGYDYGAMRYRFLMEGAKQLVIYVLIYGLVALAAYARRNRERELRAARLERELSEARLAALKMQLNPHFLFNTLNMISSHVHESPDAAEEMIAHLSDFLRMTLRHASAQEVSLATEIEFLEAYLAIMKARFEGRLAVEVAFDDAVREALVPHLVLQPLVENALMHAVSDQQGAGRLRLSASRPGERLLLVVEDNGPGLAAAGTAPAGRGVGLSNTAARLRELYDEDQRVGLSDAAGGGCRVEVEVPYRTAPRSEVA